MKIKKISLKNFRNFEALDLQINPGFNVFSGPNGAGKTNFLEGLYFTASLHRFPDSDVRQLFYDDAVFFRSKLIYQDREEETLEALYERGDPGLRSELSAGGQAVSRQKYTGRLPAVSFLPQDLGLLTRAPAGRRRYLDETLSQSTAEYRLALSRYQQALRQRNELLSAGKNEGMEIWDRQLAQYGGAVTFGRAAFLQYVSAHLPAILVGLDGDFPEVEFVYRNSGLPDEKEFLAALVGLKKREMETGTTAIGPHRDDFAAEVGGRRVAGYLSRGQLRVITLALKILEKRYLEEQLGRSPILLLDDVFSEFDSARQQKLAELLDTLEQVFLTTAHLAEVEKFLPAGAQIYKVEKGRIARY